MVKGLIPDEIRIARYKMGFNVDQGTMIRAGLGTSFVVLCEDMKSVREYTGANIDPATAFSDERLVGSVRCLPELRA
ncbi:MAG: hypothetical protein R2688_10355 [Fimbriimonadaceae bacterium]